MQTEFLSATIPQNDSDNVNGRISSDHGSHNEVNGHAIPSQPSESTPKSSSEVHREDDIDNRPPKKRKLDPFSPKARAKAASPPWKPIKVEGPTSFIKDGRRKSTRTNIVPLDLQPKGSKATTRSARLKHEARRPNSDASTSSPLPARRNRLQKSYSTRRPYTKAKDTKISPASTRKNMQADGVHGNTPTSSQSTSTKRKYHRLSQDLSQDASPPKPKRGRPRRNPEPAPEIKTYEYPTYARNHSDAAARSTLPSMGHAPANPPLLRLRFNRPPLPTLHPKNVVTPRRFSSLEEWFQSDDPLEGDDDNRLSEAQILAEAKLRNLLEVAQAPGGALFEEEEEKDALKANMPYPEPSTQYHHQDHLMAHVRDFFPRLDRERKEHMAIAKKIALAAAAKWKEKNKSPEQIERELINKQLAQYKRVRHEMQKSWEHAFSEAKKIKIELWQKAEQARGTKELDNMLEKKTKLLLQRQRGRLSMAASEDQQTEDGNDEGDDESHESSDEDDDLDSDVMSETSSSDDQSDTSNADSDDGKTIEELQLKYGNVPEHLTLSTNLDRSPMKSPRKNRQQRSISPSEEQANDDTEPTPAMSANGDDPSHDDKPDQSFQAYDGSTLDFSQLPLEEVADELMDSSNSESESGTEESSSEEYESGEESEEDVGMLGFFSAAARNSLVQKDEADQADQHEDSTPTANLDKSVDEDVVMGEDNPTLENMESTNKVDPISATDPGPLGEKRDSAVQLPGSNLHSRASTEANITSAAPSERVSGATNTSAAQSDAESTTSAEPLHDQEAQATLLPTSASQIAKIEVPLLLRGTLREYQHFGLEWLAGLHKNETNGILADEMGLGKTIQTIALLAHLAVKEKKWGPHLIVVPTSVILNWVVEFKRWCPGFKVLAYYGTQKERDAKRKGWSNDDAWNVCITSYQLALQDVKSLKRKKWYYMVLDEAHNIKNFRSKRWETLLTFKTARRLLLTGTPLQNNLTELWSLLFFLDPRNEGIDGTSFSDLENFNRMFKRPADAILDYGREAMDDNARETVAKLHGVLRPHLLRRLKQDVEKQMPPKYEHVVPCRLSKRQRQLYDGYMRRTDTRAKLSSGNYMSMINVLMQLRKVCNHPDLFETRPIVTSFAMKKPAIADYEIKDLLIRKRLLEASEYGQTSNTSLFKITCAENISKHEAYRRSALAAVHAFRVLTEWQRRRLNDDHVFNGSSLDEGILSLEAHVRKLRYEKLFNMSEYATLRARLGERPIYGRTLLEMLTIKPGTANPKRPTLTDLFFNTSSALQDVTLDVSQRSKSMESTIQRFAFVTPAVVAIGLTKVALTREVLEAGQLEGARKVYDPFHEARTRLAIAFPDKGLIQYDCGKLQRLAQLLRTLESGGHRALIFTQMTKILDILEQFLNLHGYRYLRLDGQTKLEQRQLMTERFNNDSRITVMILSSRSGGLGINLTGADSVIFYDLDWNPAMDKQCQDRCHRIGQTREVNIFRFVSQGTIEANILRKSNQKRMLDDVFIQEGEFTTDRFNMGVVDEFHDDPEAGEALDRVLGVSDSATVKLLEEAEDQEDVAAARIAQLEAVQDEDAADFDDKAVPTESGDTPKPQGPGTPLAALDTNRRTSLANTTTVNTPLSASTPLFQGQSDPLEDYSQFESIEWTGVDINSRLSESFDERDKHQDESSRELMHAWLIPMQLWELRGIVILPASERNKKKPRKLKDPTLRIRR